MVNYSGSFLSMRSIQRLQKVPLFLLPLVVSATLLSLLVVFASLKFTVSSVLWEAHPRPSGYPCQVVQVPEGVSLALLHFATTPEVPQQSKEEISVTMRVLMERGPSNFLVFGMWHDSLLWATFNHGGRTAFLDESQDWIDRMKDKHPQLETYKVNYGTTLGTASELLETSRKSRSGPCRANQPITKSSCPLAITRKQGVPEELLSVDWDVIMIDGPRSYKDPSFPGRMSVIYTASVMARARSAPGHVDIFVHDISRPVENEYGKEFLCMNNLVSTVGDLWHFRVHPSSSPDFCLNSSTS